MLYKLIQTDCLVYVMTFTQQRYDYGLWIMDMDSTQIHVHLTLVTHACSDGMPVTLRYNSFHMSIRLVCYLRVLVYLIWSQTFRVYAIAEAFHFFEML